MGTSGLRVRQNDGQIKRQEQAFRLRIVDNNDNSICVGRILGRLVRAPRGLIFNCNTTQLYRNYEAFGVYPELAKVILPELGIERYEIEYNQRLYGTTVGEINRLAFEGVAPFNTLKGKEIEIPMLYMPLKHWVVGYLSNVKRFVSRETNLTYVYGKETPSGYGQLVLEV